MYDVIISKLSLSLQCTRTPVASDLEATFQQLRNNIFNSRHGGWLRTDTDANVQAQTNDEHMLRHSSIKHMLKYIEPQLKIKCPSLILVAA